MKIKHISPYPVLNEDFISKQCKQVKTIPDFFDSNKQTISFTPISNHYQLNPSSNWSIEKDGFTVEYKLSLGDVNKIFYQNVNTIQTQQTKPIAPAFSEIGICLEWSSKKSYQRGFSDICFIKYDPGKTNLQHTFSISFKKAQVRGNISFYLSFFIKNPDLRTNKLPYENLLANKEGIKVSNLMPEFEVVLDVSSGIFPLVIDNTKKRTDPLWFLELNFANLDDSFEENVKLILNANHINYVDFFSHQKFNLKSALFKQILVQSIFLISLEAQRLNPNNIGKQFVTTSDDSVQHFLDYLTQTHQAFDPYDKNLFRLNEQIQIVVHTLLP